MIIIISVVTILTGKWVMKNARDWYHGKEKEREKRIWLVFFFSFDLYSLSSLVEKQVGLDEGSLEIRNKRERIPMGTSFLSINLLISFNFPLFSLLFLFSSFFSFFLSRREGIERIERRELRNGGKERGKMKERRSWKERKESSF
jgi:hypothetical protein